ncbi:MAG: ferredoxin-thioredoxin reductase catalytic domain-containing protein [Candidatus Aenigmatarchaeota archaeon]
MTRGEVSELENMITLWNKFADKKDFALNPDKNHVGLIFKGLRVNEKKYGIKLCPCRLRDGTKDGDLKLICPCNFKAQDIWADEGRCWCGLFMKIK